MINISVFRNRICKLFLNKIKKNLFGALELTNLTPGFTMTNEEISTVV